jgi:hypothetical protein
MAGNGDNNNVAMGVAAAGQALGEAVTAGLDKLQKLTLPEGVQKAGQTVTQLETVERKLADKPAPVTPTADASNAPLPTMKAPAVPKEVHAGNAQLLGEAKAKIDAVDRQVHAPTTGLVTGN